MIKKISISLCLVLMFFGTASAATEDGTSAVTAAPEAAAPTATSPVTPPPETAPLPATSAVTPAPEAALPPATDTAASAPAAAVNLPPHARAEISEESGKCIYCHEDETPTEHKEWQMSKHFGANIGCFECHGVDSSAVGAKNHKKFTIAVTVQPEVCGQCHEKEFSLYQTSVHAFEHKRFLDKERVNDAAICGSCHAGHTGKDHVAHDITSPKADPVRLMITKNCGGCHDENYKTYKNTYHGQVASLGYAHAAKCFDCHSNHAIKRVSNPQSTMHPDNRLETCQKCHKNATQGFTTFYPHGNTHDLKKYPMMWLASKFMILLLAGVFTISWLHCALWFYRERQERRSAELCIRIDNAKKDTVHVRRFSAAWRWTHLILAIAVITLVLTGTTVLYAGSFWAPTVMKLLGGPKIAAIIHRISALTFIAIFFGHMIVIFYKLFLKKGRKKFEWFGPTSLLPRWQDLEDIIAMIRWFAGKGPRPTFDHWTYFEKFDYWAPFWGMFIIGLSGTMLWLRDIVASVLPGWVFNVATIVHGEEAFLAAVFLFTVHYFNCHFRPHKFPQDIVMFTGTMPLEEFKHERGVEYKRLVESGELEALLVKAPSEEAVVKAEILGAVLLIFSMVLLVLVLIGFWDGLVTEYRAM